MKDVHWGRVVALGLSGLLIVALLLSFLPLGHWGMNRMWIGPWGCLFMALSWLIPLGLLGLLTLCLVGLARALLPRREPPPGPALPGTPCPECGHPTQTDWHNCPYCGQTLGQPAGKMSRQQKQFKEK